MLLLPYPYIDLYQLSSRPQYVYIPRYEDVRLEGFELFLFPLFGPRPSIRPLGPAVEFQLGLPILGAIAV